MKVKVKSAYRNLNLRQEMQSRILLLDGGFGSVVISKNPSEETYRGEKFKDHKLNLKGCHDVLCLTAPDLVEEIHESYLKAGADIIKTNSFNSNYYSLKDYGLENYVYELSYAAAKIAKNIADRCSKDNPEKKRFVAGSVGPSNKTLSLSSDYEDLSKREISFDDLKATFLNQMRGLIDGGADLILIETVFDTLNAKAALVAAQELSKEYGYDIPVMLSATISDKTGRTLSGQTIEAFYTSVAHADLFSVGLNCGCGVDHLSPFINKLSELSRFPLSIHPNAGLPNLLGEYDETPFNFKKGLKSILSKNPAVRIIGGCCGTTPEHITALSSLLDETYPPLYSHSTANNLILSNREILNIDAHKNLIQVGERTNVAGSARFARLIREGNFKEAQSVTLSQIKKGAEIIDVCMDGSLIDSPTAMKTFLNLISLNPEISKVPVMIDSSDWETIMAGLKALQGKGIVNSISLKDGEDSFIEKAKIIHSYGAAAVVMLFDEKGQADTFERKCEVAKRSYEILVNNGFPAADIIIDPNIMAIATGIPEHDHYASYFIQATKWIKENLPHAKVSGGISNLSFAFRGNNPLREALHSVFLYHAQKAGLDMAILNPGAIPDYKSLDKEVVEIIEDLIFCRNNDAVNKLIDYFKNNFPQAPAKEITKEPIKKTIEERIFDNFINGDDSSLYNDLKEVSGKYADPLAVVETVLMPVMDKIGELFGKGEIFLPQIVKSAQLMKESINYLLPENSAILSNQEKSLINCKGKVIIATVKGDVHDIGKNIVSIILKCNGYEVIDLGVMADPEEIADKTENLKPGAILLSGLITPSLHEMVNVCKELEKRQLSVPVIVGGATTSSLHTAVKIAPVYSGLVFHSSDASENLKILDSLFSDSKEVFIYEYLSKQKNLRNKYLNVDSKVKGSNSQTSLSSFKSINNDILPGDIKYDKIILNDLPIEIIETYIDWTYFLNSWGIKGKYSDIISNPKTSLKAKKLLEDAKSLLEKIKSEKLLRLQGILKIFPVNVSEEEIEFIDDNSKIKIPVLRGKNNSSLIEYLNKEKEVIGLFALTAGIGLKKLMDQFAQAGDDYNQIMAKFLADRLTEAFAGYTNYIFDNILSNSELSKEETQSSNKTDNQSCRIAVGYPSLPDHSLKKEIFDLLDVEKDTEMRLTPNYMIDPGEAVCGMILRKGKYLNVGKISDSQLKTYALKRGKTVDEVKKFLSNDLY